MSIRFLSAVLYVALIGLGWMFPLLGVGLVLFMVVVALSGRRKKWCSSYCPRGSFLDLVMAKVSPKRPIPRILFDRRTWFVALGIFLSVLSLNLYTSYTAYGLDIFRLGMVFWRICFISSMIALPLALFLNHRTWCSFCPVGRVLRS